MASARARLEILELELGTVRLLATHAPSSSSRHAAALEREVELRREIQTLKQPHSTTAPTDHPSRTGH